MPLSDGFVFCLADVRSIAAECAHWVPNDCRKVHWMLSMHQTVPDVARGIKVVMQRVLARMVACWITRYRAAYLRLALRLTCTLLIAYHPVHPSAHVSRSSSVPASACARAGAACITP